MRSIVCKIFGLGKQDPFKPGSKYKPFTSGCIINSKEPAWIQCLDCKRKSYHPKDIEHRYCGCCHKFHPPVTNKD